MASIPCSCRLPHAPQGVQDLHAQHCQTYVHLSPGGTRSSGSDTAPHSPPTPSPLLLFEQAHGICTVAMCSLAGSPRVLPRRLEMHPTTQRGDDHWSSGQGVGTSEGPQFFSPPQPSNHLSAAQEGERPRLPNPKPWCSQHPRRAGTEQVVFSLSDGARHWQVGAGSSAPCKRCCCHRQAEPKKRG